MTLLYVLIGVQLGSWTAELSHMSWVGSTPGRRSLVIFVTIIAVSLATDWVSGWMWVAWLATDLWVAHRRYQFLRGEARHYAERAERLTEFSRRVAEAPTEIAVMLISQRLTMVVFAGYAGIDMDAGVIRYRITVPPGCEVFGGPFPEWYRLEAKVRG